MVARIVACFVSILVLMEVLREGERLKIAFGKPFRFNPCFNGSVERGLTTLELRADDLVFQSLF